MKELSIEEKAKRYDEAIEIARQIHDADRVSRIELTTCEEIFPELKEKTELQKILELFNMFANNYLFWEEKGINKEHALAWLEKQGEQKPADNSNYLLSWSENEEKMLQCLEGIVKDYWAKAEQEKNEVKIKESSNVSFFLKTIHKQPLCWIKCSDRLPNKDGIYLVVTDGMHNDVYDMARYDPIEGWHKASEIIYWMPIPQLNDKSIIEQNPAEWSDIDKDMVRFIGNAITTDEGIGYLRGKHIEIIDAHAWLASLKYRVQPQPKQEWNEYNQMLAEEYEKEDEQMAQDFLEMEADY